MAMKLIEDLSLQQAEKLKAYTREHFTSEPYLDTVESVYQLVIDSMSKKKEIDILDMKLRVSDVEQKNGLTIIRDVVLTHEVIEKITSEVLRRLPLEKK